MDRYWRALVWTLVLFCKALSIEMRLKMYHKRGTVWALKEHMEKHISPAPTAKGDPALGCVTGPSPCCGG